MRSPAQVGIIGCGVISRAYAANASAFDTFEIGACADLEASRSEEIAAEFSLEPVTVEELLRSDSIDVVLNLTPPASHAPVTRAALEAGKHVYSEKPLAIDRRGGRRAVRARRVERPAPRLRPRHLPRERVPEGPVPARRGRDRRAARHLGRDARGRPGGVASGPGHLLPRRRGPLLDMGPYYVTAIVSLLGPVRRVAGFASTFVAERTIEVGPRRGERFTAETPTHITSILELEGAVTATLVATFEAPGHYASTMLVHGSDGELALPDPNGFAGPVRIRRGRGAWEGFPSRPAAPRTPAGSGSTTWSRRSRRSGRTARRRDSPPTSSTWRGRFSPRARARIGRRGRVHGRAAGRPARRRRPPRGRGGLTVASLPDAKGRAGACWRVDADGTSFRDLNGNGELDPYEDPRLPVEERVDDLLARMTLEEKAAQLFHQGLLVPDDGAVGEEPDPSRRSRRELSSPTPG